MGETQDADGDDGAEIALGDEEDLGENPFAVPSAVGGVDTGREPWFGSDRDYTYSEVILEAVNLVWQVLFTYVFSFCIGSLIYFIHPILHYCRLPASVLLYRLTFKEKVHPLLFVME